MAISTIQFSELANFVFNPKVLEKRQLSLVPCRSLLNPILEVLKNYYNKIQFESIREMVIRQDGIVLLQGPPGTGKTSTLLGLLAAQYEYFKECGEKKKIMICAPSNAAIDHITKRLICEGLLNGKGETIKPKVLRTGIVESNDDDIKSASLDHICEKAIFEAN